MPDRTDAAAGFYALAKKFAEVYFGDEIVWQRSVSMNCINESDFLRESAWVILCSGFREKTVRSHFGYLSLCFCDWESAAVIVENAELCRKSALAVFNNPRKIGALIEIASRTAREGFTTLKNEIERQPLETLRTLPYIGPITAYHLAKNFGLPVAKPDRHLKRLATMLSYPSAHELCAEVAALTGDPPQVIDLILWRYLAEGHVPIPNRVSTAAT